MIDEHRWSYIDDKLSYLDKSCNTHATFSDPDCSSLKSNLDHSMSESSAFLHNQTQTSQSSSHHSQQNCICLGKLISSRDHADNSGICRHLLRKATSTMQTRACSDFWLPLGRRFPPLSWGMICWVCWWLDMRPLHQYSPGRCIS